MIFRDPKLDKHRNNSFKAWISTYRGKKKYLSSSFRGSYSLKNRRISSLVFSGGGQGRKSYDNEQYTMQKVQNIKLDIHKSTAPAPTKIPSMNPKQENE